MVSIGRLVSITLLGSILGSALRYSFNLLLGRNFGPEALGIFSIGLMMINLCSMVAILGLDNATQKFIPIYQQDDDGNRLTGLLILCLGTPILTGTIIAGVIISIYWLTDVSVLSQFSIELILFSIGIPFYALMRVGASATRGFKRAKYSVYIQDICQPISAILIALVVTRLFSDLLLVFGGYVFSLSFGGLVGIYFLYSQGGFKTILKPSFEFSRILSFSFPLIAIAFSTRLMTWVDVMMLGLFESASSVGLYQAAFQTAMILVLVLGASNAVFPTIAADLYNKDKYDRLNIIYTSLTKWILYITFFGYLFLFFLSEEILSLFGPDFVSAQTALIILGFGQIFVAGTGPAGYLLMMSEYERIEVFNTITLSIFNAILNYILISHLGLNGAAIATGISLALLSILRVIEIRYFLGIHPYSRNYWKGIVAAAGITLLLIAGQNLPVEGIMKILILGPISFALFLFILLILGIDENDRILFKSAI